jgi:predicted transcriptional regulator
VNRYHRLLERYQPTSSAAWDSVQAALPAVDYIIIEHIRVTANPTSDRIEEVSGLKHQTVSAQIRHMTSAGLIHDSGHRAKTRSGRAAIVWTLGPPPSSTGRLF